MIFLRKWNELKKCPLKNSELTNRKTKEKNSIHGQKSAQRWSYSKKLAIAFLEQTEWKTTNEHLLGRPANLTQKEIQFVNGMIRESII